MMMTSALRTTQFSGCALAPKPATAARRAPVPATVAQAVESNDGPVTMPRRSAVALAAAAAAGIALTPERAQAVQGLEAGRIPGIKPIGNGLYQYKRPEGKSGGHGVGWSEIPPYSFTIPDGWKEVPVSIADLGGTEIDLRFKSAEEGELSVVVAPVLRFADVGYGADVRIEDLGKPEQIIAAFGPELTGNVIDPDDVRREAPALSWGRTSALGRRGPAAATHARAGERPAPPCCLCIIQTPPRRSPPPRHDGLATSSLTLTLNPTSPRR
mmetsp:Transcript_53500/g.170192  ORF Transcript_53500/g.170192 Transcript_53500/m.170192 type:complete len:270 (+) Transcript_53500:308-1117(+)